MAVRAEQAGLECVIVNGLDPSSNRAVLALCSRHKHLYPALGIYPVNAIAGLIDRSTWNHNIEPPTPFNVDTEIEFIDSVAGKLIAIGECGLDQHWVRDQAAEQERVFRRFCELSLTHDLPLIVHTRRAEERALAILVEMGIRRADFHCFGGKLKLARRIAESGFYLSIPTAIVRSETFQRIAQEVPMDRLLTETDAPYMGPEPSGRNDPTTVPRAIETMARVKKLPIDHVRQAVRKNCRDLFGV